MCRKCNQAVVVFCILSASTAVTRAHSLEPRQSPPQQMPTDDGAAVVDSFAPLPRKTEVLIRAALARITHAQLQSLVATPSTPKAVIVSKAGELNQHLLEYLELREELGHATPEMQALIQYERLVRFDQVLGAVREHRERLRQLEANPHPVPMLLLHARISLSESLLDLAKCRLAAEGTQISDRPQLRQLDAAVQLIKGEVADPNHNSAERLPELVGDAEQLLGRVESFTGRDRDRANMGFGAESLERLLSISDELLTAETKGLKHLLIERLALLRGHRKSLWQAMQLGLDHVNAIELLQVSANVLQAELELCETQSQRVACHESFLRFAKQIEDLCNSEGRFTQHERTRARLVRLEAEIGLRRELGEK